MGDQGGDGGGGAAAAAAPPTAPPAAIGADAPVLSKFELYFILINFWHHMFNILDHTYAHDSTGSRQLCEVKHAPAQLVLRWATTLEPWVQDIS